MTGGDTGMARASTFMVDWTSSIVVQFSLIWDHGWESQMLRCKWSLASKFISLVTLD